MKLIELYNEIKINNPSNKIILRKISDDEYESYDNRFLKGFLVKNKDTTFLNRNSLMWITSDENNELGDYLIGDNYKERLMNQLDQFKFPYETRSGWAWIVISNQYFKLI